MANRRQCDKGNGRLVCVLLLDSQAVAGMVVNGLLFDWVANASLWWACNTSHENAWVFD